MIKIDSSSPLNAANRANKKKAAGKTSDDRFSSMLDAASDSSEGTAPTKSAPLQQSSSVNIIMAQSSSSDALHARKKLVATANNALDGLESLRRALLLGAVPQHVLRTIESRMQLLRQHADAQPMIHDIIDEIELRAAVELAKFEQSEK